MLDQLRDFLTGGKTAEGVDDALRREITVPTGFEQPLREALAAHRIVIVAGSAGGGKTHLLHNLLGSGTPDIPRVVFWPEDEPSEDPFVRVVSDLTAVPSRDRLGLLQSRPANCVAVAIAANEGPLHELGHIASNSDFAHAVDLLHLGQVGLSRAFSPELPLVLDVGGYDPVQNQVVSHLLDLPILRQLVAMEPCKCDAPEVCPRKSAWQMLESAAVRDRVNSLLSLVNLGGQTVLFRDLWNFIADLALGGSCADDPPSSPWFWRVFYGENEISTRLRQVADPMVVVFPKAEAHLWYGDWNAPELAVLDNTMLLALEDEAPFSFDSYRWLKTQFFFLAKDQSTAETLRNQVDLQLAEALSSGKVSEIVAAINSYMTYGTEPPSKQALVLWSDMGIERRTDRARGQVSLGAAGTASLSLRRSLAAMNLPPELPEVHGAKYFLVHTSSEASLQLSPEALNLLRGGRSYRSSDRPHTDMEWHIARFFTNIAVVDGQPQRLGVLELDFDTMTSRRRTYQLSRELRQIELSGA